MGIFGKQRLGIDLGTANTIIYVAGKGIALRQPSIIALDKENGQVMAYGKEAAKLVGRTSERYETIHPLRNGVIANFSLTKQMLSYFMQQAMKHSLTKPEVVICVPSKISKVERKAMVDAIRAIGINRAMIVEEAFAAAVGADLAIEEPRGKMVVDIGGGTTDLATISFGEIIHSDTLTYAGSAMNDEISNIVRHHHQVVISYYSAETLKMVIGNALQGPNDFNDKMMIKGRSVATGLPQKVQVDAQLVAKACDVVIQQIVLAIKQVLEQTPPELSADIMETGITLTGGGSLLKRLPERLTQETGLPVNLAKFPMDCAAIGAGNLFNELERQSLIMEKKSRL